jgi:hypothetical protein
MNWFEENGSWDDLLHVLTTGSSPDGILSYPPQQSLSYTAEAIDESSCVDESENADVEENVLLGDIENALTFESDLTFENDLTLFGFEFRSGFATNDG